MATTTIRSSGGDYPSILDWEAGTQGDLSGAGVVEGVLYDDWPSGNSDSSAIEIAGSTNVSASDFRRLTVASGHRHNGTPQSGWFLELDSGGNTTPAFRVNENYFESEYLDIKNSRTSGSAASAIDIYNSSSFSKTKYAIGQVASSSNVFGGFGSSASTSDYGQFISCLAVGGAYGFHSSSGTRTRYKAYNCTAVNASNTGFVSGATNTSICINCVSYNAGTADFSANQDTTNGDYNASSDTSANVFTNYVTGIASTDFADAANDNYFIHSDSALYHAGSTSGASTDITGQTFDASTPSIGFDECIENVSTIRLSGGDYPGVSDWEAGTDVELGRDSNNSVEIAECYDDWASGLSDNATIAGATVHAAHYRKLTVAAGHRHDGTPQSGFFMKKSVNFGALVVASENYFRMGWIDVENTGTSSARGIQYTGSPTNTRTSQCIAKGGTGSNGTGFDLIQPSDLFESNLAYECGDAGFYNQNWEAPTLNNCSSISNNVGFKASANGSGVTLINCVEFNSTTSDFVDGGAGWGSSNYNAGETATAANIPGTNSVISIVSGDFANHASKDWHLSGASSALYHASAANGAVYDIDGDAFDGSTPSIGFDEYVTSGGESATPPQGNAALSTTAPTVSTTGGVEISPPQTNLALSLIAPTVSVSNNLSLEIPAVNLSLSSVAPSAGTGFAVPAGDLFFSSSAPNVSVSDLLSVQVPVGDLVITKTAPIVGVSNHLQVQVPRVDLGISSTAPVVGVSDHVQIQVPSVDLVLDAQNPSASVGISHGIQVPAVNLTLSPTTPQLGGALNIEVPAADIAISGFTPVVRPSIEVPRANLSLSVTAPLVSLSIEVPTTDLAATSSAPAVSVGFNLTVPHADLTAATIAPLLAVSIMPPTAQLALAESLPGVRESIEVPASDLTVSAQAPSTAEQVLFLVPGGSAGLSSTAPVVVRTTDVVVPSIVDLVISSATPLVEVTAFEALRPPAAQLALSVPAPKRSVLPISVGLATVTSNETHCVGAPVVTTRPCTSVDTEN